MQEVLKLSHYSIGEEPFVPCQASGKFYLIENGFWQCTAGTLSGGTMEGLIKALAKNNMVLSYWDEGGAFLASFGAYKGLYYTFNNW
jgi:hypothetical protein